MLFIWAIIVGHQTHVSVAWEPISISIWICLSHTPHIHTHTFTHKHAHPSTHIHTHMHIRANIRTYACMLFCKEFSTSSSLSYTTLYCLCFYFRCHSTRAWRLFSAVVSFATHRQHPQGQTDTWLISPAATPSGPVQKQQQKYVGVSISLFRQTSTVCSLSAIDLSLSLWSTWRIHCTVWPKHLVPTEDTP